MSEQLVKLIGKEVEVVICIDDVFLSGKMFVGSDSRFKPPHRLCVHDSKGNTLLLNLDKDSLDLNPIIAVSGE